MPGSYAPAPFGRLDLDAIVDGFLGGVAVLVVVGHAEQLAQRDGAHRLGVELLVGADLVEELAFLVHPAEQLVPAAADDGRELVLGVALRSVAGALEGEQGHGGGGGVVVVAGAVGVGAGEAPLAGTKLAIGEPFESERDGALGLAGAAVGFHERFFGAGLAAGERDADGGGHDDAGGRERTGSDVGHVGGGEWVVDQGQVLCGEDLVGEREVVVADGGEVQVVGDGDAFDIAVAGAEEQVVFEFWLEEEQAKENQRRHVDDRAQEPGGRAGEPGGDVPQRRLNAAGWQGGVRSASAAGAAGTAGDFSPGGGEVIWAIAREVLFRNGRPARCYNRQSLRGRRW